MTVALPTIFSVALTALAGATRLGMLLFPNAGAGLRPGPKAAQGGLGGSGVLAGLLLALWGAGAVDFALRPAAGRTWAGWALVAGVSALWADKSAALVFNPKGRTVVSSISDPKAWRKIGLARLSIVPVLAVLTLFA